MEFLRIDITTAFQLCAANPARVIGADARKGRLAPGLDADLVALDGDGRVRMTVCRGRVAFDGR